jgi:hypothetical protein
MFEYAEHIMKRLKRNPTRPGERAELHPEPFPMTPNLPPSGLSAALLSAVIETWLLQTSLRFLRI